MNQDHSLLDLWATVERQSLSFKPTPWINDPSRNVMVIRHRGRVAALHDWAQLWVISQITYWQAGSRVG